MATKAEQFKSRQQRSAAKKKPARATTKKPARPAKKTAQKDGAPRTRNASAAAGRKASFALEEAGDKRPSRKSTRSSTNRQKPDSNLKRRETRRVRSPARRAAAGK